MPALYIGIDCGATHLRVGVVNKEGEVLSSEKIHSPLKFHSDHLGTEIQECVHRLLNHLGLLFSDIQGIGIGLPGPIDFEKGEIMSSANLHNSQPVKFKLQIDHLFNKKVYFDRDTNIALMGEKWKGVAVDKENVLMLTLGTGIGGSIMFNGEISHGHEGWAGEVGHMYLRIPELLEITDQEDPPTCGLGHRGCFEALMKSTNDLEKISYYLGYGLASCVDLFNPEVIIIGGGMLKQGNFLPDAVQLMKKVGMQPAVEDVSVIPSQLGDLAGILGAAKLVIDGESW